MGLGHRLVVSWARQERRSGSRGGRLRQYRGNWRGWWSGVNGNRRPIDDDWRRLGPWGKQSEWRELLHDGRDLDDGRECYESCLGRRPGWLGRRPGWLRW